MYSLGFALGSPVLSGRPHNVSITRFSAAPTRLVPNALSSNNKDNPQEVCSVVGIDLGTTNSAVAVSFFLNSISPLDFPPPRVFFPSLKPLIMSN